MSGSVRYQGTLWRIGKGEEFLREWKGDELTSTECDSEPDGMMTAVEVVAVLVFACSVLGYGLVVGLALEAGMVVWPTAVTSTAAAAVSGVDPTVTVTGGAVTVTVRVDSGIVLSGTGLATDCRAKSEIRAMIGVNMIVG